MKFILTIASLALMLTQFSGVFGLTEEERVGAEEIQVNVISFRNLGYLRAGEHTSKTSTSYSSNTSNISSPITPIGSDTASPIPEQLAMKEPNGMPFGTNKWQLLGMAIISGHLDEDIGNALKLQFMKGELDYHKLPELQDFHEQQKSENNPHFHLHPKKNAESAKALHEKLLLFKQSNGQNLQIMHNIPSVIGKNIPKDDVRQFIVGCLGAMDLLWEGVVFDNKEKLEEMINSRMLDAMEKHKPQEGLVNIDVY